VDLLVEAEKLDVTRIYVRDYVNLPTDVLAVTETTLKNKPDVIRRFLKAVKRGTEYTIQNVDPAAQIGIKYGLDTKDPKVAAAMIQAFNTASVSDGTREHGLGWFDLPLIQRGADFYQETGLVKSKIDVNRYFTNQFVSQL
jgi:NitT/TauT family transport system substrate-binding protein